MISTVRMCDYVKRSLERRMGAVVRRDARIGVLEARVKRLAARIGVLNERLGVAKEAERARRVEIRELRRAQLKLPL